MKLILTSLTLLISSICFSQELPEETYQVKDRNIPIKFKIKKNNRFSIEVISGDYKVGTDSIYFYPTEKTSFNVNLKNDGTVSDSLKLVFKNNISFRSYYSDIYIGIKTNNTLVYKGIPENILYLDFDEYYKQISTANIPKADTLYLAYKKRRTENSYIVEEYAIPKGTTQADIDFKYIFDEDVLTSPYNATENYFVFEKDTLTPVQAKTYLKPTVRHSNFSNLPILVEKEAHETVKEATSDAMPMVIDDPQDTSAFISGFKYKDLKTALKNTELENILVVFNYPENEANTNEYSNFIKQYNENLSYSYKDSIEKSRFSFYLCTKKDKSKLKKLKLEKGTITFLNYKQQKLHSFKENIDQFNSEFRYGNDILEDISIRNYLCLLDNEVNSPTLSSNELTTVFKKISEAIYDLPKYGYKLDSEYYSDSLNPAYNGLSEDENDNGYKIKATPQQVKAVFGRLIELQKNRTDLEENFTLLALDYLNRNDYYKMLFNMVQGSLNDLDFKVFDYVITHHDKIKKGEFTTSGFFDSDGVQDITNLIRYADNTSQYKPELDNLFKQILKAKHNSPDVMDVYLKVLEQQEASNITEIYSDYFNNAFKPYQSIIEQLDNVYTSSSITYEWSSFKENFAHQCNNMAWDVYLDNNTNYVQNAIQWSKTSLQLQPTNSYFLDTLAHLYYINGQQQEAIKQQQLAIKYAEQDPNFSGDLDEYKTELKRFQE